MNLHYKRGFTLIELMIALLILGLLTSLVAPLTIKQLDRASARRELLTLKKQLKHYTTVAFVQGRNITVNLRDQQLTIYQRQPAIIQHFEYITFPAQQLQLQSNGFMDRNAIAVNYGDQPWDLTFADISGLDSTQYYRNDDATD